MCLKKVVDRTALCGSPRRMNPSISALAALENHDNAPLDPVALENRWSQIRALRRQLNSRFKKGDEVYSVSCQVQNGVQYTSARFLRLTSLGDRQGTGIALVGALAGENLKVRISMEYAVLLASREEVQQLHDGLTLDRAAFDIARRIRLEEEWLQQYRGKARPAVVREAEARLAGLRAQQPGKKINWW